jgi:hypothetical protein
MAELGKNSPEFAVTVILSTIRRADITGRMRWRWRAHLRAFHGHGRSRGDERGAKAAARVLVA